MGVVQPSNFMLAFSRSGFFPDELYLYISLKSPKSADLNALAVESIGELLQASKPPFKVEVWAVTKRQTP